MLKLVVARMLKLRPGEKVKFSYKTFDIVRETAQAYYVKPSKNLEMLEGNTRIVKEKLDKIISSRQFLTLTVVFTVRADISKPEISSVTREKFKELKKQALSNIRARNQSLKTLYKEIEKVAV